MSLYNKAKKRNGTKKELLCSSSMKPELTNTHLRSQHDALCLIFRHPHEAMIDLLHAHLSFITLSVQTNLVPYSLIARFPSILQQRRN